MQDAWLEILLGSGLLGFLPFLATFVEDLVQSSGAVRNRVYHSMAKEVRGENSLCVRPAFLPVGLSRGSSSGSRRSCASSCWHMPSCFGELDKERLQPSFGRGWSLRSARANTRYPPGWLCAAARSGPGRSGPNRPFPTAH
jgi:hypothetical protein